MKTSRRKFISKSLMGGMAATMTGLPGVSEKNKNPKTIEEKYEILDQALDRPVLKMELFPSPVILASVELLRHKDSFLCRVRSKDGAEGLSVGHSDMKVLWPLFFSNLQPFFIGQDARNLDLILEKVFIYQLNFRYNGRSLGIPLATIEFAILDMLGKIARKPMGELIGEIHNPEVGVYMATEFRHLPLDEHLENIIETVSGYDVNALKIKVGYQHAGTTDIHYSGVEGKTEKLIPLVRKRFGDDFSLYADSNGYYSAKEAIKVGRILEEYNYEYFEEPVLYWHFEEIKAVADALTIPIANGEQDQSYYNFRWLLANDGIEIVQPDNYYFGGYIRSMKVARMADALGKTCVPHMSGGGLGYLYDIHFVSALPNAGPHHETHGLATHVPFECSTSDLNIVNGKIKVPKGPGLGIVIDPDFIQKHKLINM